MFRRVFIRIVTILFILFLALAALSLALLGVYAVTIQRVPEGVAYGEIEAGGQTRSYLLYVPASYKSGQPVPLVLSFHGFAEWPAHQMEISRWNALADQYGFLVAYPRGTGFPLRWSVGGFGSAGDPSGEIEFVRRLIDRVNEKYPLDPARIYANGLSNGGGMSDMLACALSDKIAAIGGVSGAYLFPPEECHPNRPVPVIAFHGTADRIVPYAGGPSSSFNKSFPAVTDWAKTWAVRNGCSPVPEQLPDSGEVSGVRYADCAQQADVILYTIHGGGHAWPGGGAIPEFIVGWTTQDVDATRLMWFFFQLHSLR